MAEAIKSLRDSIARILRPWWVHHVSMTRSESRALWESDQDAFYRRLEDDALAAYYRDWARDIRRSWWLDR